jgi:hypothetical protein
MDDTQGLTKRQKMHEYASGKRQLLQMGNCRETAALRTLVDLASGPGKCEVFWRGLGLDNPHLSWWAFEIPTKRLLGPVPESSTPGDIDLLVGRLEMTLPHDEVVKLVTCDPDLARFAQGPLIWQLLAQRRLIAWPPRLTHLAAVEARAGRWFADDTQHGLQSEREKYRLKARGLLSIGFDSVILLHLVGTEPVGGANFGAWLGAGGQAVKAVEFFEQSAHVGRDGQAEGAFGEETDEFSEVIVPFGSVPGRSELLSGSITPHLLRQAAPRTAPSGRTLELRRTLEERLTRRLETLARPVCAPFFVQTRDGGGPAYGSHEPFGLADSSPP